ncbi:MAG: hypothetical protein B7Z37_27435 [Verrucomicrobia bacterium 12-59-8]|nr:MAG: hypothetical protein B7Z37_27435 [Verrucomicrobia bacterium 12-59-8]
MKSIVAFLSLMTVHGLAADPVAAWSKDVTIKPVSAVEGRHTIHTYYLTNPESPDGKWVLFFTSTDPQGHLGEVRMIERATQKETVLADNVHTEDAHRVACQQWLSGGKGVAFHEVIDKKWRVVVVDVETLKKTIVAEDHQVGFGRPEGDLLPMYGCHWNPGPFRDLEVWDASSGKTTTYAKISEVEAKYGEWLQKEFAGKPCSIFFPVLSPDLKRVFFKVAAGNGGDDYMSSRASHRQGTVVYDFEKAGCIWQRNRWGHPAWTPDSQHIFEAGNISFDIADNPAKYTRLKDVPVLSGTHPSVSPDGTLMVTDGMSKNVGGKGDEWGIQVVDMNGGKWVLLHSFAQNGGAKSWRRNHPHPAFSADGKRIYYNVSDGPFTRLMVAERP